MSKVTLNSGDGVRIFFLFFIETICCTKEKKLKKFKKKIDFIHLHFFIKKTCSSKKMAVIGNFFVRIRTQLFHRVYECRIPIFF